MKKLLIFVPSIEDGGVEKNLYIITNYLLSRKIDVSLITANKEKKKLFNKQLNFISPNNNFWSNKSRYYKIIVCFYLLLKFYIKDRNFLILSFQANIYAIIFSIFLNLKIITRSNSAPVGWTSNILKRFIFKILFKYPKAIIVNSIDFKKQLDKKFNINSMCIYNPFDSKIVKKKSMQKINFNFFKNNKKTLNIINIGRMVEQKDQMLILKSLDHLKSKINFRCLILGKGINKSNLKNYIKEHRLNNKIKLLGFKPNPYPYIKKADIFILSSKFEGLPNVLLEAQYLKKFIISTNCPTGPREILLNGKAGSLIKTGDQNKLESAILDYSQNYNKIKIKNKINLGKKYMYRFDYELNCNKYFKLVNKLLTK